MITKSEELHQHTFIALCTNKGIECYVDVTNYLEKVNDHKKELLWSILTDDKKPSFPDHAQFRKMLTLVYSKRIDSGEIYSFTTSLNDEQLGNLIDVDPTSIVESIKQMGNRIYPQS